MHSAQHAFKTDACAGSEQLIESEDKNNRSTSNKKHLFMCKTIISHSSSVNTELGKLPTFV